MKTSLHQFTLIAGVCTSSCAGAQVLTEATSIPLPGRIESHTHHYWATPGTLATSGTGNSWDASGVIMSGTYTLRYYYAASASPYAVDHPTATLCAFVESNAAPDTWWHWAVSPSIAEFTGFDNAPYDDPQTFCEFPFDLDSSFTDTYQAPGGSATTETMEYVASGEIVAPWGTIPDVAMFSKDGGTVYVFYSTDNVLESIGSYTPGFGLFLSQVVIFSGIGEHVAPVIGIWPVPASGVAHLELPLAGERTIKLLDPIGRVIRTLQGNMARMDLDLGGLAPGIYTVIAEHPGQLTCSGRLVVG